MQCAAVNTIGCGPTVTIVPEHVEFERLGEMYSLLNSLQNQWHFGLLWRMRLLNSEALAVNLSPSDPWYWPGMNS